MENSGTASKREQSKRLSRRSLLGVGAAASAAAGSAALGGLFLGKGLGARVAQASGARLVLEVATDLSTFDAVRTPAGGDPFPTGPFYVQGPIFPEGTLDADGDPGGATSIGTFRCWGWIFDGSTALGAVSQAYEIDGRGRIQVQGLEDGTRAVTGGTGQFRNVRGEGSFEGINPANFSFRASFALQGAPK